MSKAGQPGHWTVCTEQRGPADWFATVFRGSRLITDAYGPTRWHAVRCAVETARQLRRNSCLRRSA